MVEEQHGYGFGAWPPIGAPLNMQREDQNGRDFDNSVNAVSFGFVATAILISMFLVMAIFERFLRPTSPDLSPSGRRSHRDLEAQLAVNAKLSHPSPKVSSFQLPTSKFLIFFPSISSLSSSEMVGNFQFEKNLLG